MPRILQRCATNLHQCAPISTCMHQRVSICTCVHLCALYHCNVQKHATTTYLCATVQCALLCALMHCKVQLCATYVHRMRCTNLLLWVPVCTNVRRYAPYAPNVHQMFNNAHLSAPMCTNVHLCAVNISICNTSVFKNIIYSSSLH